MFMLMPLAAIAAVLILLWLFHGASRRQWNANALLLRQEMQNLLAAHSQASSAQFAQITQSFTTQLGQVAQQVQTGLASAGNLASNAQKAVSDQLQASTQMLGVIRQQLGQVQEAGHELSDAAKQIETVLGGAKTRGMLGEVALERILADALPPASYEMQYRFANGEAVDAVVRLREMLLPIDSKFPLEDYRRMVEIGEEARKGFAQAVRLHSESIARKYILPKEGTLDLALMFLPSEGIYYELLRSVDSKGVALDEGCRARAVIPVSPSTLFAYLRIVELGLRGMQIEENAKRLLSTITGLRKQMDVFGVVYEKLGTHLHNAQQSYNDAAGKLDRAQTSLDELSQGAPAANVLQPAPGD